MPAAALLFAGLCSSRWALQWSPLDSQADRGWKAVCCTAALPAGCTSRQVCGRAMQPTALGSRALSCAAGRNCGNYVRLWVARNDCPVPPLLCSTTSRQRASGTAPNRRWAVLFIWQLLLVSCAWPVHCFAVVSAWLAGSCLQLLLMRQTRHSCACRCPSVSALRLAAA